MRPQKDSNLVQFFFLIFKLFNHMMYAHGVVTMQAMQMCRKRGGDDYNPTYCMLCLCQAVLL